MFESVTGHLINGCANSVFNPTAIQGKQSLFNRAEFRPGKEQSGAGWIGS
ncbi:hypothetical protein ACQKKX_17130 [Neorhizobium sp. NPDC001467]